MSIITDRIIIYHAKRVEYWFLLEYETLPTSMPLVRFELTKLNKKLMASVASLLFQLWAKLTAKRCDVTGCIKCKLALKVITARLSWVYLSGGQDKTSRVETSKRKLLWPKWGGKRRCPFLLITSGYDWLDSYKIDKQQHDVGRSDNALCPLLADLCGGRYLGKRSRDIENGLLTRQECLLSLKMYAEIRSLRVKL